MAGEKTTKKVTTAKKAEATKAEKAKLEAKVVGVDTSIESVVEWSQEGRKLYFGEKEDFLKLPGEIVRQLSPENRERYDTAKNITLDVDILGTMEDGRRGWEKDYAVMPGAASTKTKVDGKDPNKEYFWSRKDAIQFHQGEGYVITRDSRVKAGGREESCSYKTVGGQASPEMILMERRKDVGDKMRADRKEKRRRIIEGTTESYKETAARMGSKGTIESSTTYETVAS